MRLALLALAATALGSSACGTIGGTADHSRTLSRSGTIAAVPSIAVVPPPTQAHLPGLEAQIEAATVDALRLELAAEAIPSAVLYERLAQRAGYRESFLGWISRYRESGQLEPKHMAAYSQAGRVRYVLVLRAAEVRRERMDVRSALEEVPCNGCVGDASNIWGNRLAVIADLIDLQTRSVVWKGVGEANVITSRASRLDFGVVQYNLKQPTVGSHAAQLIAHAANGIARGIKGDGPAQQAGLR